MSIRARRQSNEHPVHGGRSGGAEARRVGAAGRDTSLDVLRGLCVLSMTCAHLAKGTVLDDATHLVPHLDGASGFVLISGFLIGVVQRRTMESRGERVGYVKLLLRTRLVYLGHVYVCLVALLVTLLVPARASWLPSASGEGGWAMALWRAATLQMHPPYASILSLYVVSMVLALPLLWLLRRDLWYLAAFLVAVVYGAGIAFPGWSQLPQRGGVAGGWDYAAWFGLFGTSVVLGWLYSSSRGRAFADDPRSVTAGWALAGAGVAVAFAVPVLGVPLRLLDKEALGPGRILLVLVVAYAGWTATRRLNGVGPLRFLTRPLAGLGSHSLSAYLVLSTVVLCVPWRVGEQPVDAWGVVLVACTVAVMSGYVALKTVGSGHLWRNRRGSPAVPPGHSDDDAARVVGPSAR